MVSGFRHKMKSRTLTEKRVYIWVGQTTLVLKLDGSEMEANCTCTLIKGPKNIIVDTMTAWDQGRIVDGLLKNGVTPDDIDYVICTHGHSDHIGNNNLFLKAKHIVGFSISHKDTYYLHPFESGTAFEIDPQVRVIPTPGHTMSDITVLLKTPSQGTVAVAGDLFECKEDIDNPKRWLDAGSEAPHLQRRNRLNVARVADYIIPGHGDIFQSTPLIIDLLTQQLADEDKD